MTATMRDRGTLVLLDESEPGMVTLIEKDRDKFCMSVEEVISSCRLVRASYSLVQQVADLRDVLAAWIDQRRSSIQSAFLSFRNEGILFVVVQKGIERDDALASDLTDLDIQVSRDENFNQLNFDVLSIPGASKDATSAFLSSGYVQRCAQQAGSRNAGERESEDAGVREDPH